LKYLPGWRGNSIFLNINITRINLDDVRDLTEIGHGYDPATDYHINESPLMEQKHFKHRKSPRSS